MAADASQKTWFGHPAGLSTLFFTEMWERFSYYGMRALLVLFMVDQFESGGMGLTERTAGAIYGLYAAGVYLSALPGGWIADRLLGPQRTVWVGGILIAAGHFSLGVPVTQFFFLGLLLVILGTGLLKPNISAMVGQLYPEGGARRDAGFTIFYMGINLGAAIGPLICSSLGEKFNWHYGFTAAGVGMVAGLIQFHFTKSNLGEIGTEPPHKTTTQKRDWAIVGSGTGTIVMVAGLAMAGILIIDPVWLAERTAVIIIGLAFVFFAWAFLFADLTIPEKKRVAVIGVLFVASAIFWSGFEQAGSSLNLFADRYTDRTIGETEIPAGWFQSLNPIFVVTLAPVIAAMWVGLSRRNIFPNLATKFALGLILRSIGFLVVALGSKRALDSGSVWPTWLIMTYLFHTIGELFLSPVGLSSVTKLAPRRLVGQMMGVWFLATSLGNLIAGLVAGDFNLDDEGQQPGALLAWVMSTFNLEVLPALFLQIVITALPIGALLLIFSRPIQKLCGGVK
jgi:POT family proton-dependent oligopeptide transporter